MTSPKRYLLTAAGKDRPGLVAEVSELLFKAGANLEDSAMTRLQGEFAILLIFSIGAGRSGERTAASGPAGKLQKALGALGKKSGLAVQVKPLSPAEGRSPAQAANPVLVSVHGADRPGIVYRVTKLLAEAGVNATDVTTHRTHSAGGDGYILYVEGEAPAKLLPERLQTVLAAGLKDLGLSAGVRSLNASPL